MILKNVGWPLGGLRRWARVLLSVSLLRRSCRWFRGNPITSSLWWLCGRRGAPPLKLPTVGKRRQSG